MLRRLYLHIETLDLINGFIFMSKRAFDGFVLRCSCKLILELILSSSIEYTYDMIPLEDLEALESLYHQSDPGITNLIQT